MNRDAKLERLRTMLRAEASGTEAIRTETSDPKLERLRTILRTEASRKEAKQLDHAVILERALTETLITVLRGWVTTHNMRDLPESFHADIVQNTGLHGGDSGHGGKLVVRFRNGTEGATGWWTERTGRSASDGHAGSVFLQAQGDWEQSGMTSAIAGLLLDLLIQE